MNVTMDSLDERAAGAFDGYLVRKDLVRKYSRQYPVPTYVVEFLLGRYCASVDEHEIQEGLAIVEKQLRDRTVRTGEEELFKARAKEQGSVKLIDLVRARLDTKNDCYIAELPSLALRDVRIADELVRDNERMLTDGFYAEVTLSYDGYRGAGKRRPALCHRESPRRSKCRSRTFSMCWRGGGRSSRQRSGWTYCCGRLALSQQLSMSVPNAWRCCAWWRSSSAITTWWSSGRAGPARAISSNRSHRMPT